MKRTLLDVPAKNGQRRVWLIGDIHLGHRACDEDLLGRVVDRIRRNNDLWIGMGDHVDAIGVTDFRFSHSECAEWIDDVDDIYAQQVDYAAKSLGPIKEQCLGMLTGNHESKIAKRDKINVHKMLCERMGAKNLGYTAWVTFRNEGQSFQAYLTHGHGGGRTQGGKVNRVQALLASNAVDVAAMGHVHEASISTRSLRIAKNGKVGNLQQWGIVTGAFLSDPEYGLDSGYGAISTAQAYLQFSGGKVTAGLMQL
jgi:predicted phosphodiesterase